MERNKEMKHKHAELIHAWADGAEIEYKFWGKWNTWIGEECPPWNDKSTEFRIKPEPKPDVVRYYNSEYIEEVKEAGSQIQRSYDTVRLTFDGETGELKSSEVLK
jgi:hypothetical protein